MQISTYLILIPIISLLCYCVLLIILLGSRKNKIATYYIYYISCMILWSLGSFLMRTSFPPSAIFWNHILCVGLISMPVIFYHFTLVLTDTTNKKKTLYFGYISAGLLLACNFMGLIIKEVYSLNNMIYYTLGPVASIMAIWSICFLLLSFINILSKVKSNKIPFIRVKFVLYGLILVIIGSLLNLSPNLGRYPIDIISNTVNAFFIVYSIYRYRFLEIKLIVKKGIAYSVYTLALTGVYIITIIGVQQILSKLIGYTNITSSLVLAVLLALIFQPIKDAIQHWIDRLFYREKLNHQVLLRDFSKIINNVLDLNELTNSLLEVIKKGLQPNKVSLLLRHGTEEYSLFCSSFQEQNIQEIIYGYNHPIVQWFKQGKTLLTIGDIERSPLFNSLWIMEKKQLYEWETELIVPINLREQLIGFLILSEKKGGESYSQEEMDLLFTLMNNVAVGIENAQMYEDAKHQAITDGLTKLYNHKHFHEVIEKYIHEKPCEAFSVAMIDVDMFKLYNDLYGHSAGDRALAKIAEVLRQSTRKEDFIARYGGEEFSVIFPNIIGNESLKAIDNIRKAVESSFMSSDQINEFLTISVGVANYPNDGKTSKEIIECADAAMYVAKRSGRNQSILYSRKDEIGYYITDQCEVEEMRDSITSAYFSAICALAATIDVKDHYTYGHSENVSRYAVKLANAAGFDAENINIVKESGLLHDIGKIGVPENILTKTVALTTEEFEIMKKHVDISITIIKHIPSLIKMLPAIMNHHERYDGKGYPRGIKGENIPLEGRCLCIVDSFDAMTTHRPYRKALSSEEAIGELKKHSGTQFDPKLTKIFIQLVEEGKI